MHQVALDNLVLLEDLEHQEHQELLVEEVPLVLQDPLESLDNPEILEHQVELEQLEHLDLKVQQEVQDWQVRLVSEVPQVHQEEPVQRVPRESQDPMVLPVNLVQMVE